MSKRDTADGSPMTEAEMTRAWHEWARRQPREARRMKEYDERRGLADARWNFKRQDEREPLATEPRAKTRPMPRQTTSVARGATTLLTPVEHYLHIDGALVYLGGNSHSTRIGPGRAAITIDGSIGDDERRAELVWAAAILYFDFLAVYRDLRSAAPTRESLAQLIAEWPEDRRLAVSLELLGRGASMADVFEACREISIPVPPRALLGTLSLVGYVGKGAHLLAAHVASLDLDDDERDLIAETRGVHRVRDLPERTRRRLLARREQQIHVRRVPALPPERGARGSDFYGTALVDLLFAGHSVSRRFSHAAGAPHRAIDIADEAQLKILYREGPMKAACAATAAMLGRSPGVIRKLVTHAKVQDLVVPENTIQAW
jgi:hypothetical protein